MPASDRRNYDELTQAIREATKPLEASLTAHERALQKHAEESKKAFKEQGEQISELGKTIAVAASKVEAIGQDTKEQWNHIAALKDKDRDITSALDILNVNVNSLHEKMTGQIAPASVQNQGGFIESTNFRWMIGGILMLLLLFLIATGNLTAKDVKDLNPLSTSAPEVTGGASD